MAMELNLIRQILAVVVCFHPEPTRLQSLSLGLQQEGVPVVWINNGPAGSLDVAKSQNVLTIIELEQNLGVATALNRGFEWAILKGYEAVVSFDQDSRPALGMVGQLYKAWLQASLRSPKLGAIGPATVDQQSGQDMFTFAPYNWTRKRFLPSENMTYEVDHLITSGCLTPCRVWQDVGPMTESLFIDWVDNEWCARARLKGYQLLMDGGTKMSHSIGEVSRPLLWRRFHLHNPLRHYYLLRNALLIAKQSKFDPGWRMHHVLYALRVIAASLLFGKEKWSRLTYAWRGLVHGFSGRSGKI
jgi:rhamnosyltransferase